MTYEEIFAKSKEIIMKSDVSDIAGHLAVEIDIVGEGEGAFYIERLTESSTLSPTNTTTGTASSLLLLRTS